MTTEAGQLMLVRHGESVHLVRGLTGGWTDTPLTQRGRQQAERVAAALERLCAGGSVELFSSDLVRARQTAAPISRRLGIAPALCRELRELNNGKAKGATLAQAKRFELPVTRPTVDWIPYPGAESWRAMATRVTAFMHAVAEQSAADHLLVVSHGNALIPVVHWWLRLEQKHWSSISFEFDCGSITRLTTNPWGERVVLKLNDTSHLAGMSARGEGGTPVDG